MMSWLGTTAAVEDRLAAVADSDPLTGTPVPSDLEPLDYRILTLLFEGTKAGVIQASLFLTPSEYQARVSRAAFIELEQRIEQAMLEKITGRGDFEPITAARAEAPQAMKRLISQSRLERDPKVRLAANLGVLKFAGVEPARKLEVTTPDKVLEQMTPEELALFAAHRQWPGRFRAALRAYLPSQQQQLLAPASGSSGPPPADLADEPIDVTPEPAPTIQLPDEAAIPQSTLPPVEPAE
jgi:hypothetical protein